MQAENSPVATTPDTPGTSEQRKKGWPKGRKRKKNPRDVNAPRQPLTGYVLFISEKRDKVRAENPTAPFAEITKILACEWGKMPAEEKQKYLEEADKDKERYSRELTSYKQTESYRLFTKKQEENKRRELELQHNTGENGATNDSPAAENNGKNSLDVPTFDVPIFTEEFLDHNKAREGELRQLRKSNTEYEEQNAILSKHIDNMKATVEKLEQETAQQRNNNNSLAQHLDTLRARLATSFASVTLPDTSDTATPDNVDSYMSKLHAICSSHKPEHESLINSIRDIIGRLEYP